MGLDTTHGCWHGAYSAFMRWREALARAAGLPPLELMEGFYEPGIRTPYFMARVADDELSQGSLQRFREGLPIRWAALRRSPLHFLLHHSDCDGSIPARKCGPLADALEALLPALEKMGGGGGHVGDYAEKTRTFIAGLRRAAKARERVEFR